MTEAEYWVHLEFRVCHEFSGLPERRHRYFWCDGFIPAEYSLNSAAPRITGRAWICNGPRQSKWEFTLLLPQSSLSHEEIDWASLLPPENTTRWMSFDEDRGYIEIEPAAARPDLI